MSKITKHIIEHEAVKNWISINGDVIGNPDSSNTLNRFRFNMPSSYTKDNNAIINIGGEYDGAVSWLGYPANTYSVGVYSQAKNDGTAIYYGGFGGFADATRNPYEIIGGFGIAFGSGSIGLYGGGGSATQNIMEALTGEAYADRVLRLHQLGFGDYIILQDSIGTNHTFVDASRIITSDVPTGVAPFSILSTTRVNNLNVDAVDDFHFDQNLQQSASPTFVNLFLSGALKIIGYTSSTADPSLTELPNDKDLSIHKNTTTGNIYLAINDGGVIKKVQLT